MMRIELRKLSDIQPYASNPRRNDRAVEAVARSIQEFGFRQPIVVDEQGVIVVGHTRYKAAMKLGFEKVPVHVAGDLSAEQLKAYRLADNKTHELADWDDELLAQELAEQFVTPCGPSKSFLDYQTGLLAKSDFLSPFRSDSQTGD